MDKLYERAVELLGKAKDDPILDQFVQELGETPKIIEVPPYSVEYLFDNSGLAFHFQERPKCFTGAIFFGTTTEPRRRVTPYSGNSPADIAFGDTLQAIEQKLGLTYSIFTPNPEVGFAAIFDLNPFQLHCQFTGSDQKLAAFAVWYMPAHSLGI